MKREFNPAVRSDTGAGGSQYGEWLAARQSMRERSLTIPEISLIAGTRVALGAGIGLLISERLNKDQRRGAGWVLLAIGALTTIPLVMNVVGKRPVERPLPMAA